MSTIRVPLLNGRTQPLVIKCRSECTSSATRRVSSGRLSSLSAGSVQSLRASTTVSAARRSSVRVSAAEISTGGGSGGSGGIGAGGGGGGGGSEGSEEGAGWPVRLITVLFALAVFGAGFSGYLRKGSVPSLVASSVISLVLQIGAIWMGPLGATTGGIRLALVASVALAGYMGNAFRKSQKFYPHGIFALSSLLLSVGYVKTL